MKAMLDVPVRFLIVGASATAIQFMFVWVFLWFGLRPALAALLAFGISFIFAYNSHRRWTFETEAGHLQLLPRYIVVQIICALSAAAAAEAAMYWFGWPDIALAVVATFVAGLLAYILTSRWAFAV